MKKCIIWTYKVRFGVYTDMIFKFDVHSMWEYQYRPEKNPDRYNAFCAEVAEMIGANSYRAVQNQINWAITSQKEIKSGHIRTCFGNKIAAIDSGFLTPACFPDKIRLYY